MKKLYLLLAIVCLFNHTFTTKNKYSKKEMRLSYERLLKSGLFLNMIRTDKFIITLDDEENLIYWLADDDRSQKDKDDQSTSSESSDIIPNDNCTLKIK